MMDIVKASYRRFGFIIRHSRHFFNTLSSRLLYNTLVRSKLEYNALVWNPHEAKYILMIEKVNKAFSDHSSKEYGYYPHLYHTERLLDMLGYKSLELRRNLSLLRFALSTNARIHDMPRIVGTHWAECAN
jgi:hypothetical protein